MVRLVRCSPFDICLRTVTFQRATSVLFVEIRTTFDSIGRTALSNDLPRNEVP